MSLRRTRWAAAAFLLFFLVVVTWPGILPFNRVEPRILGMPFIMAWQTGLLILTGILLYLVDRVEARERKK
ncbi:MAG: hypothetical protein BMS9Abin29_0839 [Gemmatimonadota bacterium]|nr:MAG: hypothetical protein BMS9Abin29_0839 [Gemmatimonadota bacterium]